MKLAFQQNVVLIRGFWSSLQQLWTHICQPT